MVLPSAEYDDNFVPSYEALADPQGFNESVAQFPSQSAEIIQSIAPDGIKTSIEIDGQATAVNMPDLRLVPQPEETGKFTAFIRDHKKGVEIALGAVTTAGVLGLIAGIGLKIKKK